MKGRKAPTSRIVYFGRTLFGKKGDKRNIAWLLVVAFMLFCCNPIIWKLLDWIFAHSRPLETAVTFCGAVEILRDLFRWGHEKKKKSKRKRKSSKKR